MKVVRLRLLLSGIFKCSAAQPIQPKFTDKRLFLPNAVLAKSSRPDGAYLLSALIHGKETDYFW